MMSAALSLRQFALRLIAEKGFHAVSMVDIARAAGVDEAELYSCFGSTQDIILSLYQSINARWAEESAGIRGKKLGDRFAAAMSVKLRLLKPYHTLLAGLGARLLREETLGVRSPRTAHIRAMGLQTTTAIVAGAAGGASLLKKLPALPQLLYVLHWGLLYLWLRADDGIRMEKALTLAAKTINAAAALPGLLSLLLLKTELTEFAAGMAVQEPGAVPDTDREILKVVFNHRKTSTADEACRNGSCNTCFYLNAARVRYFTSQSKPLHFVLPAFPAKSPNRGKVLGSLPDLGEEIALRNLNDFCEEIRLVYPPGAHITICSDGRIFSGLVGVSDEDVTAYVAEIKAIIQDQHLPNLRVVNLEDLVPGTDFDQLRRQVLDEYAETTESLQTRLKADPELKSLFNGIHRFLAEDRRALQPGVSLSRIKAEVAPVALQVIRHSNAWTRFLLYAYPEAIRLSIHPYPAHSDKTGIRLTRAADNWITPWHGVIVLGEDGYVLMKRNEAEAAGARLIFRHGRPHHYSLIPQP